MTLKSRVKLSTHSRTLSGLEPSCDWCSLVASDDGPVDNRSAGNALVVRSFRCNRFAAKSSWRISSSRCGSF